MQSIGEQLEEARKRRGISLREASEATKIRSDFLSNFEQNKFDFDLPDVYKRGFIKNYANYLKLDYQKLLTGYNAQVLTHSYNDKDKGSELFGSMNEEPPRVTNNNAEQSYGKISAAKPTKIEPDSKIPLIQDDDKSFYLKIGLVTLGALLLVLMLFGLIRAVLSGDDKTSTETTETETFSKTTETTNSENQNEPAATAEESITLNATGTVMVLVKQRKDNKQLIRKTLGAGETLSFTKSGPVDIFFTESEHLEIINSQGERLNPKSKGTAKIVIP